MRACNLQGAGGRARSPTPWGGTSQETPYLAYGPELDSWGSECDARCTMWCEPELERVTTQATDESVVVCRRTLDEGLLNLVRCYHVMSRRCGGRQSPAGPRVGVSGAIILTDGAGHAGLRKQERQH